MPPAPRSSAAGRAASSPADRGVTEGKAQQAPGSGGSGTGGDRLVTLDFIRGFAVLGITHFSKGGQGTDPAQRVVGSVAFTAVARVVLVAAKVQSEDGEDRRILARSKSNIGPDDGGFEYRLEQREPLPGLFASCVAWGPESRR